MIVVCSACSQQNRLPAKRLSSRSHCGKCKGALTPPGGPLAIGSTADFDELLRDSPLPVLVDFWATWCGPCHAVAPAIASLARSRAGAVVVAKVDTDALPDVAGRYSIRGIPTMILFKEGREAKRVSGAMPEQSIAQELGV